MKKKTLGLLILVAASLAFNGCSSKSYYKPSQLAGTVDFDGKLPSRIKTINAYGATLENGQFINPNGVSGFALDKGFEYIGDSDAKIVAADENGEIRLYDKQNSYESIKFEKRVISAAVKDGIAAVLLYDNTTLLYDINSSNTIFKQKNDDAIAVNTKIAAPKFLTDLAIFPTLDGKLLIVDIKDRKVVKDIIVSNEKSFNNIIFFDILDERLVAATGTKVISINPKFVNFLDAEVTDVIFIKNAVYIFTKDGRIVLTDPDLKVLKEKKFSFARFAGVIYGKYIYAIEKEGYLIATDVNLASSNIFQFQSAFYGMNSAIDASLFATGDSIYYDDRQFRLAK